MIPNWRLCLFNCFEKMAGAESHLHGPDQARKKSPAAKGRCGENRLQNMFCFFFPLLCYEALSSCHHLFVSSLSLNIVYTSRDVLSRKPCCCMSSHVRPSCWATIWTITSIQSASANWMEQLLSWTGMWMAIRNQHVKPQNWHHLALLGWMNDVYTCLLYIHKQVWSILEGKCWKKTRWNFDHLLRCRLSGFWDGLHTTGSRRSTSSSALEPKLWKLLKLILSQLS